MPKPITPKLPPPLPLKQSVACLILCLVVTLCPLSGAVSCSTQTETGSAKGTLMFTVEDWLSYDNINFAFGVLSNALYVRGGSTSSFVAKIEVNTEFEVGWVKETMTQDAGRVPIFLNNDESIVYLQGYANSEVYAFNTTDGANIAKYSLNLFQEQAPAYHMSVSADDQFLYYNSHDSNTGKDLICLLSVADSSTSCYASSSNEQIHKVKNMNSDRLEMVLNVLGDVSYISFDFKSLTETSRIKMECGYACYWTRSDFFLSQDANSPSYFAGFDNTTTCIDPSGTGNGCLVLMAFNTNTLQIEKKIKTGEQKFHKHLDIIKMQDKVYIFLDQSSSYIYQYDTETEVTRTFQTTAGYVFPSAEQPSFVFNNLPLFYFKYYSSVTLIIMPQDPKDHEEINEIADAFISATETFTITSETTSTWSLEGTDSTSIQNPTTQSFTATIDSRSYIEGEKNQVLGDSQDLMLEPSMEFSHPLSLNCSDDADSVILHYIQAYDEEEVPDWISVDVATGTLSGTAPGNLQENSEVRLYVISEIPEYNLEVKTLVVGQVQGEQVVEEEEETEEGESIVVEASSVTTQVSVSVSATASVVTAVSASGTPMGLWSILNQIQLLVLLLLINTDVHIDIKSYIENQDFAMMNFNFLEMDDQPFSNFLLDVTDHEQTNEQLKNLGFSSGSTLNNLFSLLCIYAVLGGVHLFLKCLRDNYEETGKLAKVKKFINTFRPKALDMIYYSLYLRLFLGAQESIILSALNEFKILDYSEGKHIFSGLLTLFLLLGCLAFTGYIWYMNTKHFVKDEDINKKSFLMEIYSELKPEVKCARLYTSFLMARRILFVLMVILFPHGWENALFMLIIAIQALYMSQIVIIRPFKETYLNVVEIINELYFCFYVFIFFLLNITEDWEKAGWKDFTLILMSSNIIVITLVMAFFSMLEVKERVKDLLGLAKLKNVLFTESGPNGDFKPGRLPLPILVSRLKSKQSQMLAKKERKDLIEDSNEFYFDEVLASPDQIKIRMYKKEGEFAEDLKSKITKSGSSNGASTSAEEVKKE